MHRFPPVPWKAGLIAALLGAAACAEDLSKQLETEPDAGEAPTIPIDAPAPQEDEDGIIETQIDATDNANWVYLDIESGQTVSAAEPPPAADWDLAFQRFHIKLNGGESGAGNVAVALVADTEFDALERAPATDYRTDEPDIDGDGDPEYIMSSGENAWYDYSISSHVLTPKDVVYVIRSVDGNYYKLAMLGYYDEAGTAAILSLRWASVEAPETP